MENFVLHLHLARPDILYERALGEVDAGEVSIGDRCCPACPASTRSRP